MALQIKHSQLDLRLDNFDSKKSQCNVVKSNINEIVEFDKKNATRYLKTITTIIGEDAPFLSDLPINFVDEKQNLYRYDWIFGISCLFIDGKKTFWNWKEALREKSSLKVQFLFDFKKTNLCVSDLSAHLLCLYPSKDISSWFDKQSKNISNGLNSLAEITDNYNKVASDIFRVTNILSNFIASDDNGKNWYLYRFLDQNSGSFGLEWHINKKVIDQFGPLLRGSIIISFHGQLGSDSEKNIIKMQLRPEIGFEKDEMCFVSPYYDLKEEELYIEIMPKLKT